MNVLKLWEERKWLFFLLLPVIIIVLFKDLLIKWNSSKIDSAIDDAEEKDQGLGAAQDAYIIEQARREAEAEMIKQRIEENERKISETKKEDIPLDWHKK